MRAHTNSHRLPAARLANDNLFSPFPLVSLFSPLSHFSRVAPSGTEEVHLDLLLGFSL